LQVISSYINGLPQRAVSLCICPFRLVNSSCGVIEDPKLGSNMSVSSDDFGYKEIDLVYWVGNSSGSVYSLTEFILAYRCQICMKFEPYVSI
jgi:hypothetical protein